jgi:hypothetical protein
MTRRSVGRSLGLSFFAILFAVGCSDDPGGIAGGTSNEGGNDGGGPGDGGDGGSGASGGAGGSGGSGGGGAGGQATVPDGVLFFDDFEYAVAREEGGKFEPSGPFVSHGWSWGKDAVVNGPGAGGWIYTAPAVPGASEPLPGVGSSQVLVLEAKAATFANCMEGGWCQTDFYLQYGDTDAGPLDTIPADVWIQHWMYIADTAEQPSLFPPTPRTGKWFYPTRNGYPSNDLEWLFSLSGLMIDSEVQSMGSSAQHDMGDKNLSFHLNLTDPDGQIFVDGRPDAASSLGTCGDDAARMTPLSPNQWWLLRVHIDHTVNPGVVETYARAQGGDWIRLMDTPTSPAVDWQPENTADGHRGMRWPTTENNWYQEPTLATTHGDWWIYIDDFALAAGEHAGGGGAADLPSYP